MGARAKSFDEGRGVSQVSQRKAELDTMGDAYNITMPEPQASTEISTKKDTSSETKTVHAVCSHDCPDSCGVLVTVESLTRDGGRAVKVEGDPAHPVTRGFLCGKVARYLERVYSPERLLYPMRRKAGVAKGLPATREGARRKRSSGFRGTRRWSLLCEAEGIGGGVWAGERAALQLCGDDWAAWDMGRWTGDSFIGWARRSWTRTICSSAGGEALKQVYGVRLGTPPQDFAQAGLIIAWGANIHGNNIHLWPFIEEARRKGARLVVIDPYRTRTAALADEHLAIRPGTDTLLALAMMHVLFAMAMRTPSIWRECTDGAEELRAHALRRSTRRSARRR